MSWNRKGAERYHQKASGLQRRPPVALLVDDAPDSRDMYGEMLRFQGYRVLEASDGADGLAVALGARPDIIVTPEQLTQLAEAIFTWKERLSVARQLQLLPALQRMERHGT